MPATSCSSATGALHRVTFGRPRHRTRHSGAVSLAPSDSESENDGQEEGTAQPEHPSQDVADRPAITGFAFHSEVPTDRRSQGQAKKRGKDQVGDCSRIPAGKGVRRHREEKTE